MDVLKKSPILFFTTTLLKLMTMSTTTVKDAMNNLHFKNIGSIAHIIYKKFPGRRNTKFKLNTKLTAREIYTLKSFKSNYCHGKVTLTGKFG